ncbi:MAG TPA: DMT family transporter [Solirubrobacteraceae bacterium]|jgi:drug/metabolite transporter (DMT)-like permease|nr:DMT family transporter [Solirubrobacteraceae bacterium]
MARAQLLPVLAGVITVVLWASAFVGIRAAGEDLDGGPLALGRLAVASVVLGAIVVARRGYATLRALTGRDLGAVVVCGLLWFGAYNVALNEGEQRVDAGTAAMLTNVGPILIALLAGVVLREGFPRTLFRGLAIAFAGAVVIGLATREQSTDAAWGALLCLAAAALYAGGVVSQKPVLARHSPLDVTFVACLVGTLVCLPFAPELAGDLRDADAGAVAWTAYLGAFPTAIAFTTWAYALRHTTAGKMGALTYLVPPLVVLLAWAVLEETPPVAALAGGALCLAGVAWTRRG